MWGSWACALQTHGGVPSLLGGLGGTKNPAVSMGPLGGGLGLGLSTDGFIRREEGTRKHNLCPLVSSHVENSAIKKAVFSAGCSWPEYETKEIYHPPPYFPFPWPRVCFVDQAGLKPAAVLVPLLPSAGIRCVLSRSAKNPFSLRCSQPVVLCY